MELNPKCNPSLRVRTKHGTYIGFRDERFHTANFRNVRFGTAERWQNARFPDTTADDVFEATQFGPAPVQPAESGAA